MPIELGNKVRDKVSGFTGIVTVVSKYLQGCDRALVESQELKDGKEIVELGFDVSRLEVIETTDASDFTNSAIAKEQGKTGGPQKSVPKRKTP